MKKTITAIIAAMTLTGCCTVDRTAVKAYYNATEPELQEYYQMKGYTGPQMQLKQDKLKSMKELIEAWDK